jgi:RNA polymerase sigma factor (sigma-70 family)
VSTNGEQGPFLERIDRHRGILFKVAAAYCASAQDREDLVAETIAQLWRSYPRFDGRVAFSTWMYRIAVNTAISFYRGEARRRRAATMPESVLERVPAPQASEADDRLDLVRELIAQLEPLDRALMLLYLEEYSYAEIGTILGVSESNVGTKIGRIKARLKRDAAAATQT